MKTRVRVRRKSAVNGAHENYAPRNNKLLYQNHVHKVEGVESTPTKRRTKANAGTAVYYVVQYSKQYYY